MKLISSSLLLPRPGKTILGVFRESFPYYQNGDVCNLEEVPEAHLCEVRRLHETESLVYLRTDQRGFFLTPDLIQWVYVDADEPQLSAKDAWEALTEEEKVTLLRFANAEGKPMAHVLCDACKAAVATEGEGIPLCKRCRRAQEESIQLNRKGPASFGTFAWFGKAEPPKLPAETNDEVPGSDDGRELPSQALEDMQELPKAETERPGPEESGILPAETERDS